MNTSMSETDNCSERSGEEDSDLRVLLQSWDQEYLYDRLIGKIN